MIYRIILRPVVFAGKTLMTAHLRPGAIFLIILLIIAAAATTGFVIRRTARPILKEYRDDAGYGKTGP
jgi:hypothetical protein